MTPRIATLTTALLPGCLMAGLLFCLTGCDAPCDTLIFQRKLSPDGRHNAVLFQRKCGSTTGFSTQIALIEPDEMIEPDEILAESGHVFIAQNGHNSARAGPWNGPWAAMEWLAPDHLLIRHAFGAQVIVREENAKGVKITVRATE